MSLISCRPQAWSEVVGQDRVVLLLKNLLTTAKLMPRGFILKGPEGLGKTSVAYLLGRALMCSGDNPLGCGTCVSCQSIDKEGFDHFPDFAEVDAAEKPGVQDARDMLDRMIQPAALSRRRICLIDEAHRLSSQAWDVFLKPLEEPDTNSIFMFSTTDEASIPKTIKRRCLPLLFMRVPDDTITGLLASLSAQHGIVYELEALKVIAKHSKGLIGAAVNWLNTAAILGKVTPENVEKVLDNPLEYISHKALLFVSQGNQEEAVRAVEEAGRVGLPTKVIEVMFAIYAHAVWAEPGTELARIYQGLPDLKAVNDIFLRWLGAQCLPADALPLLVCELLKLAKVPKTFTPRSTGRTQPVANNGSSIRAMLQGEVI